MLPRARPFATAFLLLTACTPPRPTSATATPPPLAPPAATGRPITFGESTPEAEGMDTRPLIDLAEKIRDHPEAPVLSFLVSRNGKLVFELYTSSLTRADAHYLMSVTKSFTSALVGIAIDKHLLRGPDATVAESLPRELFASEADRARFDTVTIKDVLGMSALDSPVPPHDKSPAAAARHNAFFAANDHVRFALTERLLPQPGTSFLYTDITPCLAIGMITQAAHTTALRFAEDNLFGPLGFEHYEWMHEDAAGNDHGAFGLRLRPVDMQKFGVLYLARGQWNGRQLLSAAWVDTSFTPWIRSKPGPPNYGWYWWAMRYKPGWTAHVADGWRGQYIVVVPEQSLVVTMTAYVENGSEGAMRDRLIEDFVMPSVEHGKRGIVSPGAAGELAQVLAEVQRGPSRLGPRPEQRMIPSTSPKETHHEIAR